jgi:glutathione S-transferase
MFAQQQASTNSARYNYHSDNIIKKKRKNCVTTTKIARERTMSLTNTSASASISSSSWSDLQSKAESTETGLKMKQQAELRKEGKAEAHTDNLLYLYDAKSEDDVRLTLYRDHAAWCPYCQKTWLMLLIKRVPFRVEKINMRSYGDKPKEFLAKVPNGLLPAIELDGELMTESLQIMARIEREFTGPEYKVMVPEQEFDRVNQLLGMERELFGAWCGLIFRPSMPFGVGGARGGFEASLDRIEEALGVTEGPWFLENQEHPSLVDLQYVSHVERMNASCLYWKGLNLRGNSRWKNIERWFQAFEKIPEYRATKSDYYTHVMNIPPQYGPGYEDNTAEVKEAMRIINGEGDSWRLPIQLNTNSLEPINACDVGKEEEARHEAAYKLISNSKNVARFACRGAGEEGRKQFQAPLADPNAVPNEEYVDSVDAWLRIVAHAMLDGSAEPLQPSEPKKDKELAKCLRYLRDRVGVPRDMSYPAAMQFRAHLNWAIDQLD